MSNHIKSYRGSTQWKHRDRISTVMAMLINFNYLRPLYCFLLSVTDEELDDFYINSDAGVKRVYEEAKAEFSCFGPVSRERVIGALEYVLVSKSWLEHWEKLIPQEVSLDDVMDKRRYLHDLFVSLAEREPSSEFNTRDVEITDEVGPEGLMLNK